MKTLKRKKLTPREIQVREFHKIAKEIQKEAATLNLPDDFDVVKFIHDNR